MIGWWLVDFGGYVVALLDVGRLLVDMVASGAAGGCTNLLALVAISILLSCHAVGGFVV